MNLALLEVSDETMALDELQQIITNNTKRHFSNSDLFNIIQHFLVDHENSKRIYKLQELGRRHKKGAGDIPLQSQKVHHYLRVLHTECARITISKTK